MKRMCIYLTYDRQKIVDRYVGYMLGELKTCVDYLAVVCNEPQIARGMDILEEYADDIFLRENLGFDAGGFRDGLCRFLGWDKVLEYDELVLVNDSMFGPFKPMKEIFAEMDGKEADFWGLAKHGEGWNDYVGYISEHIQSYFLTIRYEMLHCRQFREYWERMPCYEEFQDVIREHEIGFTRFFASLGYRYASLADTERNDSGHHENNYSQYMFLAYELIKKRNFPFLKRQPLCWETLYCQTQENLRLAIDYIDRETTYDVNLIWDNIIRTMDMADLQHSLHLQYIAVPEREQAACRDVAILVFVTYPVSSEAVLEYLEGQGRQYDVRIFSQEEECLEEYRSHGYTCQRIDAHEVMDLLMSCSGCSLVCVLHDEDLTSEVRQSCIGKSCFYNVWENLAKDEWHISGICRLFEREPRLGFLAPPQLNFGKYFSGCADGWGEQFEAVRDIVQESDIRCQLSAFKPPFRVTENFWIRGSILEKLNAVKPEAYTLLPYLWIYLAQDAGCYSGIVESLEYASMNEANGQYYLRKILSQVKRQYGDFHTFSELKETLLEKALAEFCGRYPEIFVYGAGEMAARYGRLIPHMEAYVVSPGQAKPRELDGIPVKYVSEIPASEDCGIVLCLNERNQGQVIPLLEKYGLLHYFCI